MDSQEMNRNDCLRKRAEQRGAILHVLAILGRAEGVPTDADTHGGKKARNLGGGSRCKIHSLHNLVEPKRTGSLGSVYYS